MISTPAILPLYGHYTEQDEAVIARGEAILAAGYPKLRLRAATGLSEADIDTLMAREFPAAAFSGRGWLIDALRRLTEWLADDAAETGTDKGFAATPTFQKIHALIGHAHAQREIVAITGEVGIGKSEAAKAYVAAKPRRLKTAGAVRVQFSEADNKSIAALARILGALRGRDVDAYRKGQLMDAIGAALRPGDCLILDECNFLREGADIARCLHDAFNVPIVMIGNPTFGRTVWGKEDSFAALANRALRFDFPASTEDDVDAWLIWAGISGTALRRAAVKVATRPGRAGGLRTLAKVVSTCRAFYPGEELDAALLLAISEQIGRGTS